MQPDDTVASVLSALADATRRSILDRLVSGDAATATELARDLPVTRQAVSKHLRVLEEAGLVASRREGRESRYAPDPGALDAAAAWVAELSRTWDTRLARLKQQAEADGR